jgi:hypothetical protein
MELAAPVFGNVLVQSGASVLESQLCALGVFIDNVEVPTRAGVQPVGRVEIDPYIGMVACRQGLAPRASCGCGLHGRLGSSLSRQLISLGAAVVPWRLTYDFVDRDYVSGVIRDQ